MRRVALLLLFLCACASARTPDVRDAQRAWMDALNALDEARIVAAFADDATAFFPVVKAERLDGHAAIAEVFHQYVAGSSKKTNIVPEELRVQQHGDVANGAWKIVHMHASNVARPSGRAGTG
jgi:ketosteroid isomerase-like protein